MENSEKACYGSRVKNGEKMKLSFEDFIIRMATEQNKKMNTCHSPSSGQFCSIGGEGGGITSEMAIRRLNNYPGEKIHILPQIDRNKFMGTLSGKTPKTEIIKVPISKLHSSQQGGVSKSGITNILKNFNVGDYSRGGLPRVITNGKTYLIEDGNHRLSAMKLLNMKTATVELINYS
jgi:hypothetical protein